MTPDIVQDGLYYVVTDRWQRFSDLALTPQSIAELAQSADEFLVHGVDVEGMRFVPTSHLARSFLQGTCSKPSIAVSGHISRSQLRSQCLTNLPTPVEVVKRTQSQRYFITPKKQRADVDRMQSAA